jgi:hypothetical protein
MPHAIRERRDAVAGRRHKKGFGVANVLLILVWSATTSRS